MVESTAEFCLAAIAISGLRRVYGIGNTQDIVHSIVSVLVFHHSPTVRRKVHRLQTFTLLVVGVGCLRAVAQLGIDGMPVLVVTYPVNNNALTPLFIARKANYLPCRIVMIGNHLPVGIGHGAHAVPAVVGGAVDVGAHVGGAHHHRAHRLHHFALVAVVIRLAARRVFHQHQPACTVVLLARFAIGVGNAVEEVLGIEHFAQPFVVVGVSDGCLVRNPLFEFRRELGQEVARRIVGTGHFARIGMVHAQLAPQEVVPVGRGLAVGVMHGGHLSHGIVVVLHGDVVARGMLNRLAVAPLLVGIALGMAAERIGHPCFKHRLAVMRDDAVGRCGHSSVGQRNLRRAVVGVVFGGCLYNC